MKKRLSLSLALILAITLLPATTVSAQAEDPTAPLWVRFCNATRVAEGEQPLRDTINTVLDQATLVENFYAEFDSGRTFLEGVTTAQQLIDSWDNFPKTYPCLTPMYTDITRILNDFLISMLYGQTLDNAAASGYRERVEGRIGALRTTANDAQNYLNVPLPTPEPVVEEPVEPEVTDEEVAEETATDSGRPAEELSALLDSELRAAGVSVLIDAAYQNFDEGGAWIFIRLNRFVADGQNFDISNTQFTFDRLAEITADWPEQANLTVITIETYDGATRTLLAETTGDDFRAYYVDGAINEDEFTARLLLEAPQE